jgi:hypothetical protein
MIVCQVIFYIVTWENKNPDKAKVIMDITTFWRGSKVPIVYSICKYEGARYLVFIVDICNLGSVAISWISVSLRGYFYRKQ